MVESYIEFKITWKQMAIILSQNKVNTDNVALKDEILKIIVTDSSIRDFELYKKPTHVFITLNWLELWEWEWEDYIINDTHITFTTWCEYEIWDKISIRYY